MAISLEEKEIFIKIRKELENSKNPLFYYDDDPDGLCSFLLLYRYHKEGKGVVVKSTPTLGARFLHKIQELDPDKVFILDKPMVEEEFFENTKVPIVWIDHHNPQNPEKVTYLNPKNAGRDDLCTASTCYYAVKQDIWIAAVGAVADWTFPDFLDDFKKQYPKLLPKKVKTPDAALFSTELGKLARIFSFLLKGSTTDVYACSKILTRIKDPMEILEQKTSQGRFIYRRFERLETRYQELLEKAMRSRTRDTLLIFTYTAEQHSMTNDLANELIYKFPKKFIIIGREKSGEVKMSLRCPWLDIPPLLEQALKGVEGYGGGHSHACGACVKKEDFTQFSETLRTLIKEEKKKRRS